MSGIPKWHKDAACKNAPVGIFVSYGDEDDDPPYPPVTALAYCNACPVKADCLQWATENDEYGVWGGTTNYQRRQLQREMERVRCPSCGADDLIYEGVIELCLSCGMSWRII